MTLVFVEVDLLNDIDLRHKNNTKKKKIRLNVRFVLQLQFAAT